MIENIIRDVSTRLNINVENIKYFTDGTTESTVFCINNKYLIKTVDELTLKEQEEFLNNYKYDYFQKIIFCSKKLNYICFKFLEGNKFDFEVPKNINNVVDELYKITNNYKEYEYEGYGYLFDDHKSWYDFLKDEIDYAKKDIKNLKIDMNKLNEALEKIKKYDVPKYLVHGDFGTHNFLINNGSIKVIDPMGVVGDYLYDFYYSIFSSYKIFSKISIEDILKFYDRDYEYKKSLLTIVFFIRLSRCYKYDRENINMYLDVYNNL